MSMSIEIENKAYSKIMLHILKNVANDCYGVLIGDSKSSGFSFRIIDAIPLFHNRVFTPQTEFALKMV